MGTCELLLNEWTVPIWEYKNVLEVGGVMASGISSPMMIKDIVIVLCVVYHDKNESKNIQSKI